MGTPTGPQGQGGPGGPYPPEGYGPPPEGYGRPAATGPSGPPPQMRGPAQPLVPPQQRQPEGSDRGYAEPLRDRPVPRQKGFLGSLLDVSFDNLVTPTVIKAFSVLSLLLISAQCTIFLALGLWIFSWQNFWAWGLMMVIASPFVWLFEVLLLRMFMESVIVRFKTAEYLRVIKDKL